MSNKIVALLAVPLVFLAWFAGVKRGQSAGASPEGLLPVTSRPGTPVATFDGQSISLEELKAQIEEQAPLVRARYTTPEGKREMLERVVRMELLAREAQRRGYANDPDVVRQHKRNMVAVFVQKEFEEAQQKQPVPEDEIKRFYDAHVGEYVKPERVRVADVFFAAPASDPAARQARKAAAEKALGEAKLKDRADFIGFQQMARELSEDPDAKASGGDLRFLTRDELAARAGPEVAEAAFKLSVAGEVNGTLVESPAGFHVIKLLGRENALDLKLDDVREAIRSRILFDKRSGAYQKFVEEIERKAGLSIDTARLNDLKIEAGRALPPPGAIPPAPIVRGSDPSPAESAR